MLAHGSREPPAIRFGPEEANKVKYQAERNKGLSSSRPSAKSPAAKPPPEQSEGWCASCKIDVGNKQNMRSHLKGKRHKYFLEQNAVKVEAASKIVDKQARFARDPQSERNKGCKAPHAHGLH